MTIRAAAIQIGPIDDDPVATLAKCEAWLRRAGEMDVDLAVLPEGIYPGFASINRAREDGSPEALRAVYDSYEPIPGPATERIGAVAHEFGMVVAFGMVARDGDRAANTSILFDEHGTIVGVHRKAHQTPDYEAPFFEAGETFAVAQTRLGPIGHLVCADLSLPETTRILAIKGARIICGSLAAFYLDDPEHRDDVRQMYIHSHTSPTRAIDNDVFLVHANMVGRSSELDFFGRSRIIDPHGLILAEASEGVDAEEILVADLDIDAGGKLPFRLISRRRPDLYGEILTPNPEAGRVRWEG